MISSPKEAAGTGRAVGAIRSAVRALNDGDIDGYFGYFDPACPRWVLGFAHPLALRDVRDGLEQLRAGFAELHLGEDLLFGDERFVCARWRMTGRHEDEYFGLAATGLSIDVETCEIYEVAGDRVITSWVYGDLLAQLLGQICEKEDDTT
jgi:predicted ester cyclase